MGRGQKLWRLVTVIGRSARNRSIPSHSESRIPWLSSTWSKPRRKISLNISSPFVWRLEFQQVEKASCMKRTRWRVNQYPRAISSLACPGDQSQFVVLNQVRMRRNDAHIESVAPAFRGRNYSAKAISSVVSAPFNVQEIHGVRITKCSIVRFTDVRLYSNVCGLYRSEEDPSDNLQFVAHEHGSSTPLRCFYRFDADMRPINACTVFPLRQLQGGLAIVCAERLEAHRGWFIQSFSVFLDHSVGIKDRGNASHRLAHKLDPGDGNPPVRFRVVKWNNLIFQDVEQDFGIDFVLKIRGAVGNFRPDCPAVLAVVSFAPPAV